MDFNEKQVKSEYLYKGKILNLKKDDVVLPDGKTAIREVVEHCGGSAILCEKDGKVLMVKQFRYPFNKEILEIPAGKVNKGEDPKQTAIRELSEEGGITVFDALKLCDIYPSTGYTNEIIHIYKAIGELTEKNQKLDDDEFLSCKWYDKKQLLKMIKDGEICDAKTIVALLYDK